MTIAQLIEMTKARLATLSQLRESAVRVGDVQQVLQADCDLAETQKTLDQLQSLPQTTPNQE
jgi:hypothetical protein